MAKDKKWIQKATSSIKKRGTEGICTGSKFGSSSCPAGSKRYNLAKTFKKMAKSRKKENGGLNTYDEGGLNLQQTNSNMNWNNGYNPQNNDSYYGQNQGNNQLKRYTPLPREDNNPYSNLSNDPYNPNNQESYFKFPIDNAKYTSYNSQSIANTPTNSKFKFDTTKIPQLHVGSPNPYFNSAINHFNNSLNYGFRGINELPKAEWGMLNQNYNSQIPQTPNVGYPNNIPVDPNQTQNNPTDNTVLNNDNQYTGGLQQPESQNKFNFKPIGNFVASGAEATLGAINTGKGILDTIDNQRINKRTQQLEAQQRQQSIFNDSYASPYETKGYGTSGRDNAIYGDGGKTNPNFEDYYKTIPKEKSDTSNYNLREAYNELPYDLMKQFAASNDTHLPDIYKLPNHPTFSTESKYYKPGMKAGYWENDSFIPLKANGGLSIKEIGENGMPNTEIEGKENVTLPNGFSENVQGATHKNGGIPLNLPNGTMIFSEKLKDPIEKKSYAKLAKKFETKDDMDMMKTPYLDKVSESTSQLNIKFKNNELQKLFQIQEENKLNGLHSNKIKKETEKEYMKYGGKIKYADGGKKKSLTAQDLIDLRYNPVFPHNHDVNHPQGTMDNKVSHDNPQTVNPVDWEANRNQWTNYGVNQGLLDSNGIPAQNFGNGQDPKLNSNTGLQEFQYDTALDDLDKNGKNGWGYKALTEMWKTGSTNQDKSKYTSQIQKVQNPDKYNFNDVKQSLKDLRGNFIDSKLETRHLTPPIGQLTPIAQNTPTQGNTQVTNNQPNLKSNQYNFTSPDISLGLPSTYARDPQFMSQMNPQYIDPRYLDINPQLNEIARGKRAVLSTLGDRGTTSISNALQAQINAYGENQKAYGTKYGYDRQQDSQAQEFNANSKMNADKFNIGERDKFYGNIAGREGVIETQKQKDANNLILNAEKQKNYVATSDYINKTFNPSQYNTGNISDYLNLNNNYNQYRTADKTVVTDATGTKNDKTVKTYKRNGGKISIKPKLKKR